jgi:cation:H+ antiporter
VILTFLGGLILLITGAELLVRGASRAAAAAGIAPLVIGLTVVSFGTSAPELAVTAAASLRGEAGLALGNVIGSNILNVLLILGASALVAPLLVDRRLIRLEVPFMIAVSAGVAVLALDRTVGPIEGLLLLAGGLVYTGVLLVQARRDGRDNGPGIPGAEREAPPVGPRRPSRARELAIDLGMVLAGLGLLVLGSRWIVEGAVSMAGALGVPDLVIGLTVVSGGTSLPELATSVVAAVRGEREMAVGNIVGSNIFNLLIILGSAAAISGDGLGVPLSALTFDFPVMIVVAMACLPIFFTGHRISRFEGFVFLSFYLVYTVYLVLDAAHHHAVDELAHAVLFFVLPLTVVVLADAVYRELERRGTAG